MDEPVIKMKSFYLSFINLYKCGNFALIVSIGDNDLNDIPFNFDLPEFEEENRQIKLWGCG